MSQPKKPKESPTDVIDRQFVHGTLVNSNVNSKDDAVFVKENLLLRNGEIVPNLRILKNFKVTSYVTKRGCRNHNDKKEFEYVKNLESVSTNTRCRDRGISRLLNGSGRQNYRRLKELKESPYVYGVQCPTEPMVKYAYKKKYRSDLSVSPTLAVMDYECDVCGIDNGLIISGVISMGSKVQLVISRKFMTEGDIKSEADIRAVLAGNIPVYMKERIKRLSIRVGIMFVDNAALVAVAIMRFAHAWKPDFLTTWAISMDIHKFMMRALDSEGIPHEAVFCDPSVPKEYRYFKWQPGKPYTFKADGTKMNRSHVDIWHVVVAPASFQIVCSMALFRTLRKHKGLRNKYDLDSVISDLLSITKVRRGDESDKLHKIDWHKHMQTHDKPFYMAYMLGDSLPIEMLNEKYGDFKVALLEQLAYSKVQHIGSMPTRVCVDLHIKWIDAGVKVMGCSGESMVTPLSRRLPSTRGWIVTLASELERDVGQRVLSQFKDVVTNAAYYVYDSDITSAYVVAEIILNISVSTREAEFIKLVDGSRSEGRALGFNLCAPKSNSLMIAKTVMGFPTLLDLGESFMKDIELGDY